MKFIDLTRTGPTVRRKRTQSRGKVREQAVSYAYHLLNGDPTVIDVLALFYTSEDLDRAIEVRLVTRGSEPTPDPGFYDE